LPNIKTASKNFGWGKFSDGNIFAWKGQTGKQKNLVERGMDVSILRREW
jgi:hypothetical protein